jgi:hypothetical protein
MCMYLVINLMTKQTVAELRIHVMLAALEGTTHIHQNTMALTLWCLNQHIYVASWLRRMVDIQWICSSEKIVTNQLLLMCVIVCIGPRSGDDNVDQSTIEVS